MSERESNHQFTEEDFKKHLRFLTKKDFDEKIEAINSLPNIYHKMEELLNTEELDQKYRQYYQDGDILKQKSMARAFFFQELVTLLVKQKDKKIEYSSTQPEE